MRRSEPPCVRRDKVDAGAAQGGEARRRGAVQCADAVLLIHALAGTGDQTHTHHPISMDLGLALPEAAGFMSGAELRGGSRRVPRCPPTACSCIFLKPCQGRRILRVDTKLNKIRVLCLFAGGRSHRRGGFFVRWGRRAPPVPAAAGVNLLRFPRPRRGRAPLLDNRTLFRHRGPQGPLWPG